MIITKTPFRVSFFGGGTDYYEWFKNNDGHIITSTIDKYCYLSIRKLPEYFNYKYRIRFFEEQLTNNIQNINHPIVRNVLKFLKTKDNLEIVHQGDLPGYSGLGGSSAFTVGLLHALYIYLNKKFTKEKLYKDAIFVEKYLSKENVGYQDQVSTTVGGINYINFKKNKKIIINKINFSKNFLESLKNNSILISAGNRIIDRHMSKKICKAIISKKKNSLLHDISTSTLEILKNLQSQKPSIKQFADTMNYQWDRKKNLSLHVTNSYIDNLIKFANNNGCLGSKLLGAGSGGYLYMIFNEGKLKSFLKKIPKKIQYFKYNPDFNGSIKIFKN